MNVVSFLSGLRRLTFSGRVTSLNADAGLYVYLADILDAVHLRNYELVFSLEDFARLTNSSFVTGLPCFSRRSHKASALFVRKGFSRMFAALV